ncbi:MAG: C25 family cysteine peptidase, partial [Syntrophothermus sp.]
AGDANYDYKNVMYSPVRRNNLVPSFGMPVSDVWFTTFDSTNLNLQQMYVGRIPANNNNDLQRYLVKHQNYISRKYSDWNKKYLFFSGGDSRNPSELSQIKAANDDIYFNLVLPSPTGGIAKHFYKTISPPSNFGPFTPEQVQEAISNSGLFISYIGHSGTQTWDNGITSVEDIKNSYPDRFPLISDFGCSTGKFAEPDVDAFGELFTSEHIDGQAISYLGNSSLGFLTTSLRFPKYFYQYFLADTMTMIGQVHFLAKIKQFNLTGVSDVNKVFNYCNLLFGDPIISLSIPKKPNFVIKNSFLSINGEQPNDLQDSLEIKLILKNEGLVLNDSLNISLSDTWRDSITFTQVFKYPIPLNDDTIYLRIPCKNKSGLHLLRVELDKNDLFPEIYENDNTAELNYIVYTSSVRPIINDHYYATLIDSLDILNAQYKLNNSIERIKIQLADNKDFINPLEFNRNYDTLKTKVNFENLIPEKRYWWRAKIDNNETNWSENFSFTTFTNRWYLDKLFNLDDIEFSKIYFDSTSSGFKIANRENLLKLKSAGWLDGSYASLLYNHQEYITNTFFAGIATGLIDTTTLNPSDIRYFNNPDSMISYLTNLPNGTLIAMMAAADPVQYVLGWSPGTPIRNLIKTFGSAKVDSIMYRDSWCMIGKKGAPIGSVPEAFKKSQTGFVSIDSTKWSYLMDGSITTPIIANSSSWLNVTKRDSLPEGSNLEIIPIGINKNGSIDTLVALSFNDSIADINFIDSSKYSKIKLLAKFNANQNYDSPVLYSLGVNYNLLPELTTNYQVVHLSKDSLMQGDSLEIGFRVVNVSETKSDSFNIHLNIIRPDNSTFSILDTSITSLLPNKNISLNEKYISNLYDGFGLFKYNIVIDVYNNVNEIYEDNNIYSGTFNIKKDTTTSVNEADVNVSFDGLNILDGDLVSSKPNININVHYPIWYPVNDSTSFEIYIDDVKCSPDNMSLNYDTIKRSLDIKLSPEFKTGEHYIRVFMKNNLGRIEENARYDRFFNVYDEFKVLDVFNYPNPFKQKTSFTFNLTENDVKVHIKIYTVAGRLIKEIYPNDLLKVGFNNIEWDGKDQDGDEVSNGVYLYKVIIEKDGKTDTKIQKLSKVK